MPVVQLTVPPGQRRDLGGGRIQPAVIIAVSFGVAAAFGSPVMWLWFRNTLKRKVPAAAR